MTDKISNFGRTAPPTSGSGSGPVRRAEQGEAPRRTGGEESTRTDAVALTDTAVRLKRIEASLAQQPEIDEARVETVRERIASGDYRVSGDEVAGRLLQLEQSLG